jgi:hypothetical protein
MDQTISGDVQYCAIGIWLFILVSASGIVDSVLLELLCACIHAFVFE